ESARMMTVKVRVVGEAPKQLAEMKPGERISLKWSEIDIYSDAVREGGRYDATKKSDKPFTLLSEERFTFPAEFVSYDATNQFMTVKMRIPADSVPKLKPLKPGE